MSASYLKEDEAWYHIKFGTLFKLFSTLLEVPAGIVKFASSLITIPVNAAMAIGDLSGTFGQEANLARQKYLNRWQAQEKGLASVAVQALFFTVAMVILRLVEWTVKAALLPFLGLGKLIELVSLGLERAAQFFYDQGDALTPKAPPSQIANQDILHAHLLHEIKAARETINEHPRNVRMDTHLEIWGSFIFKCLGRLLSMPGRGISFLGRLLTKPGKSLIDLYNKLGSPGRELMQFGFKAWHYTQVRDVNIFGLILFGAAALVAWTAGAIWRFTFEWPGKYTVGYPAWGLGKMLKAIGTFTELLLLGKAFTWLGQYYINPDPNTELLDERPYSSNIFASLYKLFVREDVVTQYDLRKKADRAVRTHRAYFEKRDLSAYSEDELPEYDKAVVRGTYFELSLPVFVGEGTSQETILDQYPNGLRKEFKPSVLPISEGLFGSVLREGGNHFGPAYKFGLFHYFKSLQSPDEALKDTMNERESEFSAGKPPVDIEQADLTFMREFLLPVYLAENGLAIQRRRNERHSTARFNGGRGTRSSRSQPPNQSHSDSDTTALIALDNQQGARQRRQGRTVVQSPAGSHSEAAPRANRRPRPYGSRSRSSNEDTQPFLTRAEQQAARRTTDGGARSSTYSSHSQ